MDKIQELLSKYFGYEAFREGQEDLIRAQLARRDVFGIMPTGGGKSLCYQIPALMMEGITLVVSPLISLMKDQVMALKSVGVAGAYINSSLTPAQIRLVYRNVAAGMYKIIYVAPERLQTEGFCRAVAGIRISMLAVDEAHCISQWGQDFRPSYLQIVDFLRQLPYRPVVSAFTATATRQVQEDVIRLLGLENPLTVVTGFDRPNLHFQVLRPKSKPEALCSLMAQRRHQCGIVYCSTRKEVEKVCDLLQEQGFSATRYHAGLEDAERRQNQEDFVYDRRSVMVATNAFGMGINKSNVGFVIHYNMPQSMEAYYQEAGRAGRDGSPADCILLYAPGDVYTAKFLIQHPGENPMLTPETQQLLMTRDLQRLEKMIGYCKTESCLRGYILGYFGQPHEKRCHNCGNCNRQGVQVEITPQTRQILECVRQIHKMLGYYIGPTAVIGVLAGSAEKRILSLGLDSLSAYGSLKSQNRNDIRTWVQTLESKGYLRTHPEHGGLFPTEKAGKVLSGEERVFMFAEKAPAQPKAAPAIQPEGGLLGALKSLRSRLALEAGVPAYIVFSNAALEDMARKAPCTMEDFLKVKGVGQYKAQEYGEVFLAEIRKYLGK